jgi:hypothetical protein
MPAGEWLHSMVRGMMADWERATSNIGRLSAECSYLGKTCSRRRRPPRRLSKRFATPSLDAQPHREHMVDSKGVMRLEQQLLLAESAARRPERREVLPVIRWLLDRWASNDAFWSAVCQIHSRCPGPGF